MAAWLHLGVDILQEFAEAQRFGEQRMSPEARQYLRTLLDRIAANESEHHQRRVIAARQRRRRRAAALGAKELKCLACDADLRQDNMRGTLRTRYCSKKCGFRYLKRRKVEAMQHAREQERAPLLAARPPCRQCGGSVVSPLLRAVHCSIQCARRTSKQRAKGRTERRALRCSVCNQIGHNRRGHAWATQSESADFKGGA